MFDTMISKSLIQVIWIVASLAVVVASFSTMFVVGGGGGFFLGLVYLVLGLAWVRVLCEGMIILFVMNDNLQSSARSLQTLVESQNAIITRLSTSSATATSPTVPKATGTSPESTPAFRASQPRPTPPSSTDATLNQEDSKVNEESKSRLGEWPT